MIIELLFIYLISIPVSFLTFILACEGDKKNFSCETAFYKKWFSVVPILNTVIIVVCCIVFLLSLVVKGEPDKNQ